MKWPKKLTLTKNKSFADGTMDLELGYDGFYHLVTERDATFSLNSVEEYINEFLDDKKLYLKSIFDEEIQEIIGE